MKPHKLSAFVFSAILVASQINFRAEAQEVLPKGIVFYKTSSAANSDTAQAREYQSLEPAPVVVNGISLEGAEFTIQRNRLVEVITYPNLRTIRTPAEIEALKEAGRKLTNAKSAYPLAATVIEPRLAAFTEIANKLNQGAVLVGGVWEEKGKSKVMEANKPSSPLKANDLTLGNGKTLRGVTKAVIEDSGSVKVFYESGVISVPISLISQTGIDALGIRDELNAAKLQKEQQAAMLAANQELQEELKAQALAKFNSALELAKEGEVLVQGYVGAVYLSGDITVENDGKEFEVPIPVNSLHGLAWYFCAYFNGDEEVGDILRSHESHIERLENFSRNLAKLDGSPWRHLPKDKVRERDEFEEARELGRTWAELYSK